MMSMSSAIEIIRHLDLQPHPEGGHYRETFRAPEAGERGAVTAIFYLLQEGEVSAWHRVDAVEQWHYYAGAPLELSVSDQGVDVIRHKLGADLARGETPQVSLAPYAWQSARSLGDWTLVGCTVSPAFTFEGFELAPAGWVPGSGHP